MKASSPVMVMIRLLLKWWWLVAIAVALGGGIGYFVRSRQPDIFFARSTILFGQIFSDINQQSASFEAVGRIISITAGFVQRENILQPVVDRLNLGVSVDELKSRLAVNAVEELPLLEITVADRDPVQAANIANAIAQQIIDDSPYNNQSAEVAFRRQQLSELQKQINSLQAEYNDLQARGANLNDAFAIAQNQEQAQQTLATLQEIQQLYADLSQGLPDQGDVLRIYSFASAQNAARVSGSITSVILAAVAGLVISLGTIVLIAFFDDRLVWQEGEEEVEGERILGPLGLIPKNKLPLYLITMPESPESEMIRQLRAKLVLAAGGNPPKILTVTSYDSGDGKTTTASNLALASAESGLKTLLVDGDIRKGNMHEHFRLPNVMGLSDLLAGRDDLNLLLSRALLDTGYDNLTVLTSGRASADPAALLSRPRLGALMDLLKTHFDIIIFDSVPTIGGSDSAFLAELSSGVLIVVHGQRTTHRSLKRTLQTLRQGRKVEIYGIAFNRIALQITSAYSKPYYRRNLAINPEKLNQELLASGKRPGLISTNRNIMVEADGTRYYSLAACSVQLGVSKDTLEEWIETGYLKAERKRGRSWIAESEINAVLDQLPRHEISLPVGVNGDARKLTTGKTSSGKIRDLLRGQRDALLASARESNNPEHPE